MIWLLTIVFWVMASPAMAIQLVTGSYVGNAIDNTDIVMSPPCQPVAVFVKRDTATVELYARFNSMGTNISKSVTGTATESSTNIKSFNSNGFRLGTGSSTNGNGSTHYYVAICDTGNSDIAFNTWAGDNTDNKDIAISPAFTPELVIILQSGSGGQSWRGANSHTGDDASRLNSTLDSVSNEIQSFAGTGFQVGSAQNSTGTTYYSMAIKASSGALTGSFSGDATDNRNITAINTPKFALLKGDSSTNKPAYRFGLTGDNAWCSSNAQASNIIQSFSSTGFQIGTNSCANENAVTIFWFTLADATGSSGTRRAVAPLFFTP